MRALERRTQMLLHTSTFAPIMCKRIHYGHDIIKKKQGYKNFAAVSLSCALSLFLPLSVSLFPLTQTHDRRTQTHKGDRKTTHPNGNTWIEKDLLVTRLVWNEWERDGYRMVSHVSPCPIRSCLGAFCSTPWCRSSYCWRSRCAWHTPHRPLSWCTPSD